MDLMRSKEGKIVAQTNPGSIVQQNQLNIQDELRTDSMFSNYRPMNDIIQPGQTVNIKLVMDPSMKNPQPISPSSTILDLRNNSTDQSRTQSRGQIRDGLAKALSPKL